MIASKTWLAAIVAGMLLAISGCGGGTASAPSTPVGTVTAPAFGDADPVAFGARGPSRYAVHGIDVARYQTGIDWRRARAAGVNFAFIKATEGGDRVDPQFETHWRGAAEAGVAHGAYHFYYFCTTPEVQAQWFIRNVPRGRNQLPPVLDMEWNPLSPTCAHLRPPPGEVRDLMRRWSAIVAAHYGQRPIVYTTPEFYRQNGLDQMRGVEFWLRSTAKLPEDAFPGQSWTFWQYTATGIVPGIAGPVDLNVFSGSRADWAAWLAARRR